MTVSEKIDKFVSENGGTMRDALNIALTRLEFAERILVQVSEADGTFSTNALTHADNTIQKMRDLADSYIDNFPTVITTNTYHDTTQ